METANACDSGRVKKSKRGRVIRFEIGIKENFSVALTFEYRYIFSNNDSSIYIYIYLHGIVAFIITYDPP